MNERTTIVFVEKQESADFVLKELLLARYSCLALHGGIDQNDRDSIISDYKHARVKVLVATSVAARGLDVRHCYLVVNYDSPNHYEDYVHRVGRTGRAGQQGIAWTFLTPSQGRYAADIIKAFELSAKSAPDEIKKLYNEYKQQQELQGKKVKSGGGFSGKGFKFDEAEAQMASDKKKQQKAAFGLQDSDEEEENDIDAEIESMLAPKKSVKQVAAAGTKVTPAVIPVVPVVAAATTAVPVSNDKLDAARRLAAKLAGNLPATSTPSASSSAAAVLMGESISETSVLHRKAIAEQMAERLQAKLGYTPRDISDDASDSAAPIPAFASSAAESFQRFEEELEINDFPQQARWRVTSREALAQISEYSDAGLTVRGTYFAPGVKVPDGERKLYLAIEGTSELAVSKAYINKHAIIKIGVHHVSCRRGKRLTVSQRFSTR